MAGLYPDPPVGALSPATANPLFARQVAAQRAANPRPDITRDLAGLFLRPELLGNSYDPQAHLSGMAGTVNQLFHKFGTPENPMGPFGFGGITAFHGSPHKFDNFDMKKIGTGEGAQAYGHGLYFAENPGVAKSYAGMSKTHPVQPDSAHIAAAQDFVKHGMDPHEGLRKAYPNASAQEIEAAVVEAKGGFKPNLYKVDLPDDQVAKMLDWDKPLSQQPESVQKLARELGIDGSEEALYRQAVSQGMGKYSREYAKRNAYEPSGEHLYAALGRGKLASDKLRELGVPGIKYLDQGSRSGGKGTSNFVVFDDRIPKIIGRE
jgi:hypothetical protein